MILLKVSGIFKREEENQVLNKVSFTQNRLQKIAIAGETGSGKSTLLKIIAGHIQPDSGEVLFENRRVEGPAETLVSGHPQIAYLSQHFELPKFLSVEQVLSYSNTISEKEAHEIYDICQISHLLERKTNQLSGGERQRISLARLITSSPKLLLLDEPFSNLDISHKNMLKKVISDISNRFEITCILISHDPADTLSWADEILVLKKGQVMQKSTPEKIYKTPVNEYVAGLFGKYNLLDPALFRLNNGLSKERKKKKIILRPEEIEIGPKKNHTLNGIVKEVYFFGSHYEIEIANAATTLFVKETSGNFIKGENVYLHVKNHLH